MSRLVDVKGNMESGSETRCCEEGAISQPSDVPVFDKLYLRDDVKQIQPPGFIRNKNDMDHWFRCVSQLLCPPQANGYSFMAVNRRLFGFTGLVMPDHQQLSLFFNAFVAIAVEIIRTHVFLK